MLGLRARVPATSANLGPGFDTLAVALDRWLEVTVVERQARRVLTEGEGAEELAHDDTNLIWRALTRLCVEAGAEQPEISLAVRNDLPLERGLGSSAAAAVAGLVLGRALTGAMLGDGELLRLAVELEGHPDNAAAALVGGLVLCQGLRMHRLTPTDRLRPVICVPEQRLATGTARGVLPAEVSLADAAANTGRAAAVLLGLSGLASWDPGAMTDVLHEPTRLGVLPDTAALVGAVREQGFAACLSGAGPSVLAIVPAGDEEATASVRELARRAPGAWRASAVEWERAGATVADGERLQAAGRKD
ncbi:MAG: homoserine kinase [Egibacteraceae bacterium]